MELTAVFSENHQKIINSFRVENIKLLPMLYSELSQHRALYDVRKKVQFCSIVNSESRVALESCSEANFNLLAPEFYI
jgi:hypothetical protein